MACVGQASLVTGIQQVLYRLFPFPGQFIVPGDQPQILPDPFSGRILQPACHLPMVHPAQLEQHRLVGHIPQQSMLKDVLFRTGKSRTLPAKDQLPVADSLQKGDDCLLVELGSLFGFQLGQRCIPEQPPNHRGSLQEHLFRRGQAVQAGLEHPGQGRRHPYLRKPFQLYLPVVLSEQNHAVLDQHVDQLFDVERVALRTLDNQITERAGYAARLLQNLAHQSPAGSPRKGPEFDLGVDRLSLTPTGTALEQRRAGQADHQQARVGHRRHELVEQIEGAIIRPMDILQQDHGRLAGNRAQVLGQMGRGQRPKGLATQLILHRRTAGETQTQ